MDFPCCRFPLKPAGLLSLFCGVPPGFPHGFPFRAFARPQLGFVATKKGQISQELLIFDAAVRAGISW